MTPHASVCLGCGTPGFPARLRCHHCGGMQFAPRAIGSAEVAAVTRVHRVPPGCPYTHLLELSAPGGLRLLAAARFAPDIGCTVQPQCTDDGAVVVLRPEERNSHD